MSRVVILLSDKRSGSTMFQEEFCRHSDVQTVPYSPHTYLETHWWLMSAVLLDRPRPLFISNKVYDGYGSKKNARAYMVDLLDRCVPEFKPPSDSRSLIFDGWEALCATHAKPVFFEKSPQHLAQWASLSLFMEWMDRTKFDVRVIGLVRNPHGALYSASKLFGSAPETRQFAWMKGGLNLLALEGMLGPNLVKRVHYEDIVQAPSAAFADILDYCGLNPDSAVGTGTKSSPSEKWKDDPDYRLQLDPSVMQVARCLGYPDDSLLNATTGDTTVDTRRKGLRLWINRRRDRMIQPMLLRIRAAMRGQG